MNQRRILTAGHARHIAVLTVAAAMSGACSPVPEKSVNAVLDIFPPAVSQMIAAQLSIGQTGFDMRLRSSQAEPVQSSAQNPRPTCLDLLFEPVRVPATGPVLAVRSDAYAVRGGSSVVTYLSVYGSGDDARAALDTVAAAVFESCAPATSVDPDGAVSVVSRDRVMSTVKVVFRSRGRGWSGVQDCQAQWTPALDVVIGVQACGADSSRARDLSDRALSGMVSAVYDTAER